ncbi:2'-5' RNA ligase family protein [Streptomyces sp. CNQ085]|uniref:2'-5' RNA ligase family protein n=1 Tax=Streptomyces sp. CNQ085 TaxID=2886944 RepID=UPI001F50BD0F|nr:2'-5' RNA ligase family protein [Streptomyces sp. CNQ085]MCI0383085.1 2'-5' RNA ligase family protein [Streptomyces sp. CNQ085]
MRTVELLPDATTDLAVRRAWRHLAAAGMPSQEAHTHPTNRPHLTLATADALPGATREDVAAALGDLPVGLCLDGLLRFTGRTYVLAWAVRPDPELLRLHTAVWRALTGLPGTGGTNPLHAPGRWVPHITLGRSRRPAWSLTDGELLPAGVRGPVRGRLTGARSYDSATRTTEALLVP